MSDENHKAQAIEDTACKKTEEMVAVVRGLRRGLGFGERIQWRKLVKEKISKVQSQPIGQPEGNPQPLQQIRGRFFNSPRLLNLVPIQKELSPEDKLVENERKLELLERAEKRARRAEEEKKAIEHREALQKAKENFAVEVSG